MMWEYYSDKTILVTGGSGFLGTALIYRLLTSTSRSHIYLICRGGIGKLRERWEAHLPIQMARSLYGSKRLTVLDGDILLPGLRLSRDEQDTLRASTNIVIHSASTINLGKPLHCVSDGIIGATIMLAQFATTFRALDRFVYVSTAFANAHLYAKSPDSDIAVSEEFHSLYGQTDADLEWLSVQKLGTSQAYEQNNFPFAYAYAKHLTERLLSQQFLDFNADKKLLIVRPSIIGPAQCLPLPGYCMPMSSPASIAAASLMLIPSWRFKIATQLKNPESDAYTDAVPVDVVVDRLLTHSALGTYGCVHAVSGVKARFSFQHWWQKAMELRRIPWKMRPVWVEEDWKTRNQHRLSRLYAIWGTSFAFSDEKTTSVTKKLGESELLGLNLFTKVDVVEHIQGQTGALSSIMRYLARGSLWLRLEVWLLYRNLANKLRSNV